MTQSADAIRSRFERLAVEIGRYASAERAWFRCRRTFRGVPLAGKSLLEIGAGAGVFSAYAITQGASHVTALEPELAGSTEGYVSALGRMQAGLGAEDFEVLPDTIQAFDPGDRKFDIVLSYNSVNHLDEPMCMELRRSEEAREVYRHIFRKVAGMMVPGGHLILADASRYNFFGMIGLRAPLAPTVEWEKHQSPRTWLRLLEPLGFRKVALSWRRNYPLRYLGPLGANRVVNFFLSSHFRLVVTLAGEGGG